jgi:hypothetical protein
MQPCCRDYYCYGNHPINDSRDDSDRLNNRRPHDSYHINSNVDDNDINSNYGKYNPSDHSSNKWTDSNAIYDHNDVSSDNRCALIYMQISQPCYNPFISANIMAIIMSLQAQNVRTDWLDATCGLTMASAKTAPI